MSRPDTSTLAGIGEALAYLMDEIHSIRAELHELRGAKLLRPSEAERALGYGRGYLSPSRYPWRVPEFGAQGTLHTAEAWADWNRTPEGERRGRWDLLPIADRRRILGAA